MKPSADNGTFLEISGFSLAGKAGASNLSLHVPAFRLKAGTITALIGRSGAGKSVLMCTVMGRPPLGVGGKCALEKYRLFGIRLKTFDFKSKPFLNMVMRRACHRGTLMYMPQNFPLARSSATTVRKCMTLLLRSLLRLGQTDDTDVDGLLAASFDADGLSGVLDKPMKALSGGERRRVELSVRLAAIRKSKRKTILLLDEPTTGFDPESAHSFILKIRESLEGIRDSVAVLLSTHDLSCLDIDEHGGRVADEVALIHRDHCKNGQFDDNCSRLVFNGSPDALCDRLELGDGFSFAANGSSIYERLSRKPSAQWPELLGTEV